MIGAVPLVQPELSVIICTLNEHEAIGRVIEELIDCLEPAAASYEIIVVDDSPDERTADAVRACAHGRSRVGLLRRPNASGLSAAAIAGWDVARGRYLAIMDGDGQHDPSLLPRMLQSLQQHRHDLVVASRYLDDHRSGLEGFRHVLSRSGIWLTDRMLGMPLADPLSGCFAMTREWYAEVRPRLSGLGFKILVDVIASTRRRPQVTQLPTLLRSRIGGSSKLDMRVAVDLIILLIEKRTQGRIRARHLVPWAISVATLLLQLILAGVALHMGSPFLAAVVLALIVSAMIVAALAERFNLAPRRANSPFHQHFIRTRTPLALAGAALALGLHMIGAPWPVAILSGGLPGECVQTLRRVA